MTDREMLESLEAVIDAELQDHPPGGRIYTLLSGWREVLTRHLLNQQTAWDADADKHDAEAEVERCGVVVLEHGIEDNRCGPCCAGKLCGC